MKKIFMIAALICLTVFLAGNVCALTLDFASLEDAYIKFFGTDDSFSFTNNNSGYSFQITASDSSGQSAQGLSGKIDNNFTIGTITTSTEIIGAQTYTIENAPVTGTGTLSIFDGTAYLTANLTWNDGTTIGNKKSGTFGLLNLDGTVNLSNMLYQGSNLDLITIKNAGTGTVSAAFTFNPAASLTHLTENGNIHTTSYSGTLNVVPIPGALLLLGAGLVRLVTYGRRKRALA